MGAVVVAGGGDETSGFERCLAQIPSVPQRGLVLEL